MSSPHSDTTTCGIRVHAAAQFVPQDVLPQDFHDADDEPQTAFVFRYQISMTNVGDERARLLSRHWVIVDGEGNREEVRGRGVVGDFPDLGPGDRYSYVSYCPLRTSWGTMQGSYTFEREDGSRFEVEVARFFLVPSAPPLEIESPSI
jgi:ApaG protein